MSRDRRPPKTDVLRQIKIGVWLGFLAVILIALLVVCVRGPIRHLTLRHPRYEAKEAIALPHPVGAMAAGNLNGDEHADLLLAAATGTARFDIVLGGGQGLGLPAAAQVPHPTYPLDLVLGDLDGNGLDDILATGRSDEMRAMGLWWNHGDLKFERAVAPVPMRLVDVIDEDLDGGPDLVGLTSDFNEVRVHRVDGREVNPEAVVEEGVYDTSIRDFAAAHLDRRGMDVALVAGDRVRLLRSGGVIPDLTSHFNLPPRNFVGERMSRGASSLVFDDINGDARADLAYLDDGSVKIHLGLGGGKFVEGQHPVPGGPADGLAAGDFDGDGTVDLVILTDDGRHLQELRGL